MFYVSNYITLPELISKIFVLQAKNDYEFITRTDWNELDDIKDSVIYNCTPVENIKVDGSNKFIDCIVTTETGKKLAAIQASHQFKLYTGLEFPL